MDEEAEFPTKINLKVGRQTVKYFWQQGRPHRARLILAYILSPLAVLSDSFLCTWLLSQIISDVSTSEVPVDKLWDVFGTRAILYISLMLITKLFLWRLIVLCIWSFNARTIYMLYNLVFNNLQHKSVNFFNSRFAGSIVSQANRFVDAFNILSNEILWGILPTITVIILTICFLMPVLPLYSFILIGCAILWTGTSFFFSTRIAKVSNKVSSEYNRVSGQLSDATSNIGTIKSDAKECFETKRMNTISEGLKAANYAEMWAFTKRDFIYGCIMVLMASGLVFTVITAHAMFGAMIGPLVLAITYSILFLDYLWRINQTFMNLNRSFGNAREMTEILDLEPEIKDKPGSIDLKVPNGEIEFRGVGFAYKGRKNQSVFNDFNLKIKPGERVGIVGHSGGGKTTLTKTLMRYYDIDKGEILIDGQPIDSVTQNSLRRSIAYVSQEPTLFHRTLAENISYAIEDADISPAELEKLKVSTDPIKDKGVQQVVLASEQANAVEFIDKLPEGFQTMAGEKGVKLSGGQRQRISIARAIAKDAPIIVLDEATSALDTLSEKLIQKAMDKLMEGKTAIVIAHRLSTVSALDRIVVIDEGKIIEEGKHSDLIQNGGMYATLWETQTEVL